LGKVCGSAALERFLSAAEEDRGRPLTGAVPRLTATAYEKSILVIMSISPKRQ